MSRNLTNLIQKTWDDVMWPSHCHNGTLSLALDNKSKDKCCRGFSFRSVKAVVIVMDSQKIESPLPAWKYEPASPAERDENPLAFPDIHNIDLGTYVRLHVTNVDQEQGRAFFDMGLRLMMSYQHEMAARCFLACLEICKHCALAHGFVALCHSPNYNFKGEAYYESANHPDEGDRHDLLCLFPSQQVAARNSKMAVDKVDELKRLHRKAGGGNNKKSKGSKKGKSPKPVPPRPSENATDAAGQVLPDMISDVETQFLLAIRKLTCHPGLQHTLSDDIVGRPYANAMKKVYDRYPNDPEVAYYFAEALMVMNAWHLYEFPTGKAVSPDVDKVRDVLEKALSVHKDHAGLCHMYVHLSEMSACPELALTACLPLRDAFPHAGHLIHMATHIDVLVGDYESCVRYNCKAIEADERSMQNSPGTAGRESFYFGYIVHNYHMAVYGSILGGFEKKAMDLAGQLNSIISEDMFQEHPNLTAYLEAYAALDVHVMVRFGRWKEILELELPRHKGLMLFRTSTIKCAQALAHASLGNIEEAKREAGIFDSLRGDPDAEYRILHNNSIKNLLAVDAVMLRGEIAYREEAYDEAFKLLREAVDLQDNLNYDEPWGKIQPIRHALGGLLLEQGQLEEAEGVFRKDLEFHPRNPWAMVGLIATLEKSSNCCGNEEVLTLTQQLVEQRKIPFADVPVTVPCACCATAVRDE